MDTDNNPSRRPSQAKAQLPAPSSGGTVEPADRVAIVRDRFQRPQDEPAERFELRDPFAEVTYRANTLPEMVAKAEQLGSIRFTAVDADGNRSIVNKVDGQWRRAPQPDRQDEPAPASTAQPTTRRDAPVRDTNPALQPTISNPATPVIAAIDDRAERAEMVRRLEAALSERYLIKRAPVTVGEVTVGRAEYRFRGDPSRVAFTESTFRLATDTNSPSVARSMVDVAEARNWRALRVSGHEEFRRMVWFEASLRGVKAIGYEPLPSDLAWLRSERETRQVNRIEPAHEASNPTAAALPEKSSARGGGGRKTVLAAIEAVLVAKGVPEQKREAVMAAAAEKLAERMRSGQVPRVKVYDKAAPSQRPHATPTPEVQRTRDRTVPVR